MRSLSKPYETPVIWLLNMKAAVNGAVGVVMQAAFAWQMASRMPSAVNGAVGVVMQAAFAWQMASRMPSRDIRSGPGGTCEHKPGVSTRDGVWTFSGMHFIAHLTDTYRTGGGDRERAGAARFINRSPFEREEKEMVRF